MPFRPSLRWDQDAFARAVSGTTGYERLLEARAYDIIGIGTERNTIRWISPSVRDFLGWDPEEVVGVNTLDLVHPEDHAVIRAARMQIREGDDVRQELRLRSRNGRFRWFSTTAAPLYGPDGGIAGTIGGWRCIDEEIAERTKAIETADRSRTLLNSMSDPYVWFTAVRDEAGELVDLRFVDANTAAAESLGTTVEELSGATVSNTLTAEVHDRIVSRLKEVLQHGKSLTMYSRVGIAQGTFFDIAFDPVDANTVGVRWRETTSRVSQERNAAQRAIDESIEQERDRIASDLHDGFIQQVLYTGMMLANLLPDLPEEHRATMRRLLEVQDEMIRQLRATILALSRPDLGSVTPSTALERIAREAAMHLGFAVQHTADGPIDSIHDTALMQHMLFALREMILNVARHATATEVRVRLSASDHHLDLTVEDNGTGPREPERQGHGLANLATRAARFGGSFHLVPGNSGGSVASWRVPLLAQGGG